MYLRRTGMLLNSAKAKRQRRLHRQHHLRRATKAEVVKKFGEFSGARKYMGMTANPIRNTNNSTIIPKLVKAPALQKLFSDAFKSKRQ